ncbi:MAG: PDZ domain-containing protein [Saprospiraceae bacterium]|nr:PDZ domain-containing protein [Saprospiraceae bacterium]
MRILLAVLVTALLGQEAVAQVSARLFRYPDVSKSEIVFVYGGDIWIVGKEGGMATKLSSPVGSEMFPKFSPDGNTIAFSGNYDGNLDIYTLSTTGGVPERLTHHGMSDRVIDWYPTGDHLLFSSSMNSQKQRFNQFYKLSLEGGLPEQLPMRHAEFGSFNADASKIAFTDKSRIFRTWKRYEGGMAADIWMFDLNTMASEKITDNNNNDELPMWSGDRIFYMSDQGKEKRNNIWVYDLKSKVHTQVTQFSTYDVHHPSLGPDDIVFEAGGKLHLLNLESLKSTEVEVKVVSDLTSIKPRTVKLNAQISAMDISPDGKRALIGARGEVITLPTKEGFIQNITRSSGVAERSPAWSPNGRYIAYWSDKSGEYELTVRDMKNGGEEKQLSELGPGFRYNLYWSPDNKHIAFVDQTMSIHVFNVDNRLDKVIDQDLNLFEGGLRGFRVSWSHDGNWMTYSKSLDNGNSAIFIYDVKEGNSKQVTSGFYADHNPTFDPDGKYLYATSNRTFSPVYSDFDNSWSYPNATSLVMFTLRDDVESPLTPENDDVEITEEEEEEETEGEEEGEKEEEESADDEEAEEGDESLAIDFDGFERRVIELPMEAGNMGNLGAVSGKVIFHRFANSGSSENGNELKYFDLEAEEEKTIMGSVFGYRISADGKSMLVRNRGGAGVVKIAPNQKIEDGLALNDMETKINPREEWRQIFNDTWRFERDFFYDKEMHGVDWDGLKTVYGEMIEECMTRDDVNFVIGELIGELNASHTYRGGGDQEQAKRKNVGYLGIDWKKDGKYYQVGKVVRGAPWDSEVRSPLDMPGINVKEGHYILAVNGVNLNEYKDPWEAFEGKAGKIVELTVNDKPSFEESRKVVVKPLRSETRLRHLAWIESNRQEVHEKSGGKLGYIYVPSTGVDGQNELVRQFYGQWNKDGLIIDERFNNGGQIPDRFIELLNRKPLAYWAVRDGKNWQWPPVANFGSMAMLVNGWSGSGGDAFPDYFKKAGLGPLIGTRTWGGLIGISGAPTLIDGGGVTVPTFRMYNPDGTWFKEGHGVDPDIEVIEDPTQLAKGIDPQLQKAIEEVMRSVKAKGPLHPKPPSKEKRT